MAGEIIARKRMKYLLTGRSWKVLHAKPGGSRSNLATDTLSMGEGVGSEVACLDHGAEIRANG